VNLDPLSPLFNSDMGFIYNLSRRYEEAMIWYQKSLEIEPRYGHAFHEMGIIYTVQEKFEEAEKNFQEAIRLTGGLPWSVVWLSYVYSKLGKREKAESLLKELQDRSQKEYIHHSCFAASYLGLGDPEKAFEHWNDAYEEREGVLCMIKVLPVCDPFRSDPRFDELLEKMNLK